MLYQSLSDDAFVLIGIQEEFSDEDEGQDEDLSAALATLRMQQEARTQEGGAKRPGHVGGGKGGSIDGTSEDAAAETAIITQVNNQHTARDRTAITPIVGRSKTSRRWAVSLHGLLLVNKHAPLYHSFKIQNAAEQQADMTRINLELFLPILTQGLDMV